MRENRTYGSMRGGGGKTRTDNYGRFNRGRTTPPTLLFRGGGRTLANIILTNTAASARCTDAANRPSPESFRGFLPPKQTVETVGAPRAPLYTGLKPRC
jgi:hypothetical protein